MSANFLVVGAALYGSIEHRINQRRHVSLHNDRVELTNEPDTFVTYNDDLTRISSAFFTPDG